MHDAKDTHAYLIPQKTTTQNTLGKIWNDGFITHRRARRLDNL